MNKDNLSRLKKYLFLISLFFSIIIGSHILYIYLYDKSNEVPTEWWSISEWIIWDLPHLNPLINSNDYNKDIIYMIYRSILKYDPIQKKLVWDLAKCDIKKLNYIECYLNEDIKWSNWKNIETSDIVATYNIIKNSDLNPLMASLLKETTIEEQKWVIIFKTNSNDINFLNLLLQPIVSKDILDNISNTELYWNFDPKTWIYSWPYKVDVITTDDSLWVKKLILVKNEYYKQKEVLISKFVFRFFKDRTHFLKSKDTINIFNDKENLIWNAVPRLDKLDYYLNQYTALFLNEENIKSKELRKLIIEKINSKNIVDSLWEWFKQVNTPFLNIPNSSFSWTKTQNIENLMSELWYYKKDYLTSKFIEDSNNNLIIKQKDIVNPYLYTIPNFKKQNFNKTDDIIISWNVTDTNVLEVYINDYKLKSFKKWSKNYNYRLREDLKNIVSWNNTYNIYYGYGSWSEKKLIESFNLTLEKDPEKFKKMVDDYYKNAIELNEEAKNLKIDETQKDKIIALEDKYYYNLKLERLTLKLLYIDSQEEFIQASNIVKNTLQTYWIAIDAIPISINDITKKVRDNKKDYDMIIIWLDLWYFDYNLYSYFHSSQSKNWFNLSNIKNLDLDVLLEDLKSQILSPEEIKTKSQKTLWIIEREYIIKTLFKKQRSVLIDKNIKNYKLENNLPSDYLVNYFIYDAFVTSDKQINFTNKNLFDFLSFIKNKF